MYWPEETNAPHGQNHGRQSRAVRSLLRHVHRESPHSNRPYQEWLQDLANEDEWGPGEWHQDAEGGWWWKPLHNPITYAAAYNQAPPQARPVEPKQPPPRPVPPKHPPPRWLTNRHKRQAEAKDVAPIPPPAPAFIYPVPPWHDKQPEAPPPRSNQAHPMHVATPKAAKALKVRQNQTSSSSSSKQPQTDAQHQTDAQMAEAVPGYSPTVPGYSPTEEYDPFAEAFASASAKAEADNDEGEDAKVWTALDDAEEQAWYDSQALKEEFEIEVEDDGVETKPEVHHHHGDGMQQSSNDADEAYQAAIASLPKDDPSTSALFEALDELKRIAELTS